MSTSGCNDMHRLFEPRAVAVLGASHQEGKIGYRLVENIVSGGYAGRLYPVNPKGGHILGQTVLPRLADCPDGVDLAVIAVPAPKVPEAVAACGAKGVPYACIISSGFSEVGRVREEKDLVALAQHHNMRILGPNMFGIYSANGRLNATFGPRAVPPGNVAIISQSGAIGLAMIGKTAVENIGLAAIVSVGNKADLDEADLLRYLIADSGTRIILLYMEGVRQGLRLLDSLRAATLKKPVIIIKAGRSRKGALAAASHTGSLAGSDAVFDAVIRQCGALRAQTLKEAFQWAQYFSETDLPAGDNVLIITNGGGFGVLAADACETAALRLYDNVSELERAFADVMPDFGSLKNPVDLTAQATAVDYERALTRALENDAFHAIAALYCETAGFDAAQLEGMIAANYHRFHARRKPISFSVFGGRATEDCVTRLGKGGIPIFSEIQEAISPLGALYAYRHYLETFEIPPAPPALDTAPLEALVAHARAEGRTALLPDEGRILMEALGLNMPRSLFAASIEDALGAAETLGYPVAMKIVSKDILHKSDVGGVALDLENAREVTEAYDAIRHSCRRRAPAAHLKGVEVCQMVPHGTEIIVGAKRDTAFGPIVMVGLGGIYVEVMKDVAFRAFPLNRAEIEKMIQALRSYPLLLGVRGEGMRDVEALVQAVYRLGTLLYRLPALSDIEINPMVVHEQGSGATAVDIRILLNRPEE